jgi:Mrp family chromosome partitioning ATPase
VLYFLASGAAVPNANDLLASGRMLETLTKLREQFEHVVIDGPPLAAWTDSLVLATRADGVVLVVDGRKTPWALVKEVSDRLHASGSSVLGVILNRMDASRGAKSIYR